MLTLPPLAEGEDKSSPLANQLRNTYKHLRKWARRTGTDCFRLYDREIRPIQIAIDLYAGRFCIHYYAPSREELEPSLSLQKETAHALKTVFGAREGDIFWRTRSRSKTTRQYEKRAESKTFFVAYEYGVKFWVNLEDYLDTGLFLDHRETRRLVALASRGKRVLNLFAYTGAFSLQAAAHGASFTKSVDLSNTYSAWNRDNFLLNQLPLEINEIVRADCLKFMEDETFSQRRYDLIVIDPPTISRSKKMDQLFDIQTDYISLISSALKLLTPTGMIYFSTNSRKFIFNGELFPECTLKDISNKTIPLDFKDSKAHRCWTVTKS